MTTKRTSRPASRRTKQSTRAITEMLTPSEKEQLRRKAKEASVYARKVFRKK